MGAGQIYTKSHFYGKNDYKKIKRLINKITDQGLVGPGYSSDSTIIKIKPRKV